MGRERLRDNRVIDPGVFEGIVEDPWTTPGFASEYTFAPDHVEMDQFHALSEAPSFAGGGYAPYARAPVDEAYARVLDCAGAWPRDHVARTAVQEARDRTGMIRNLATGDLMMGLTAGTAPADGDGDGMPDSWETMHGLDPATEDHGALLDGWPALEVYLDERADMLTPCGGTTPAIDGGVPMPGTDAGATPGIDAGATPGVDGAVAGRDAGPDGTVDGGCGCRIARADRTPRGIALVLFVVGALLGSRRAATSRTT